MNPMQTLTNWSNLFLSDSERVFDACDSGIAALSELRRTGAMLDVFGPFRSYEAAELAVASDDPSDAGMSPDEIDWTGFYEAGGFEPL